MAFALVGSVGAVTSASGTQTPAWGASSSQTAGNLLICWVTCYGIVPSTPAGWNIAAQTTSSSPEALVLWRIATGGDAAPSFTSTGLCNYQLAEFSGNDTVTVVDQIGHVNSSVTSPISLANAAVDAASAELVIYAISVFYSTAATKTLTSTLNNGMTAHESQNAATSTTAHYVHGWSTTTGKSVADTDSFAFTTTKVSGVAGAIASFLLAPAVVKTNQPTVVSQAVNRMATY